MRRALGLIVIASLGLAPLCAARGARAATLPFEADLLVFFGSLPPVVTELSTTGVARVNGPDGAASGALTAFTLPAGVFATTVDVPVPAGGLLGGVRVAASNGRGLFTGLTPSGGGGVLSFAGTASLCLLRPCSQATQALNLPLGVVGVGGTARTTGPFGATVIGAPWTRGTTTVRTAAAVTVLRGTAFGPAGLPGSTAQPGGRIELVTPIQVRTNLPGFEETAAYGILEVRFVPEPGPLSLLAAAVAIAAVQRRRSGARDRRRRRANA